MLSMSLAIAVSSTISIIALSIFKSSIMVPIIMNIFWMALHYIIFGFIGVSNDYLGIFSSLVTGISFLEHVVVEIWPRFVNNYFIT